jgi:hypothetical protein
MNAGRIAGREKGRSGAVAHVERSDRDIGALCRHQRQRRRKYRAEGNRKKHYDRFPSHEKNYKGIIRSCQCKILTLQILSQRADAAISGVSDYHCFWLPAVTVNFGDTSPFFRQFLP